MARLGDSLDDDVSVGISDVCIDEFEKITYKVISSNLSTGSSNQYMFIAPEALVVTGVQECHVTASSSTGGIMIGKNSSTGIIGSTGAQDLLTSAIDLTTAVETVQSATLSTGAGALNLAAGDRIELEFTNSTGSTAYAGGMIVINCYQNA